MEAYAVSYPEERSPPTMVRITSVTPHSRADRHGIRAGDVLISINSREVTDVLDYRFFLTATEVKLSLTREGQPYEVTIRKREYDDIGLDFETPLMDKKHSCENKCIFCFIDQLPKGMRESLYFKDDDSRLSFLHGNYITLTNLKQRDVDRIIEMHISPVNVSVHTTNPELRVKMMKNKRAGEVLAYLKMLADAGITLYTVGSVKTITGYKSYVSIDGGMPDNPRYALYQSAYTVHTANRMNDPRDFECTIAGRCCESGDLIAENIKIQKPERNDILAVLVTGAYNLCVIVSTAPVCHHRTFITPLPAENICQKSCVFCRMRSVDEVV